MAPPRTRALAAAAVLAQLVAAGPARADAPPTTVVLLPPRLGPEADGSLRERVDVQLRLGLVRGRLAVADAPAALPDPCDQACLAGLRAGLVVRASVTARDRDYTLRLELLGEAGELLAESETTCELCGLREFGVVVADQAALLATRAVGVTRPPPALVVVTDPPGARVLVDGTPIGPAPIEQQTTAGKHHVRAQLGGYLPEDRDVELVPGVRETLRLSLRRSPRTLRLRAAGGAMLGVGLILLGAGAGLLALDGRDYPGRCDAQDFMSMRGECRYVYTTIAGGATTLAVGGLLGAAGTVLLVRTRDRGRKPRARLGAGPFGLRGEF